MLVKLIINNFPETNEPGFIVSRLVDNELWFYGIYPTRERAEEVAEIVGECVVCERMDE